MIALIFAMMAALELAARLSPLKAFRALARTAVRTPRIWGRGGGLEERKERAVQMLAARMFLQSIRALALVGAIAAPIGVVALIDMGAPLGVREALTDWGDRSVIAVVSVTYGLIRFRLIPRLRRT